MDFLQPMVLPVEVRAAQRRGPVDFYLPDQSARPQPAVLFIHGGPIPAGLRPTPRDWPIYSGGGPLSADWLREPPEWLRCVALTYPLLAPLPGWPQDPRFLPVEAVAHAAGLAIVLTRVGLEQPQVAEGVGAFVAAAGTRLEIIEVPLGHHGFDHLDDDDDSRAAITRAVDLVLATLR